MKRDFVCKSQKHIRSVIKWRMLRELFTTLFVEKIRITVKLDAKENLCALRIIRRQRNKISYRFSLCMSTRRLIKNEAFGACLAFDMTSERFFLYDQLRHSLMKGKRLTVLTPKPSCFRQDLHDWLAFMLTGSFLWILRAFLADILRQVLSTSVRAASWNVHANINCVGSMS